MADSIVLSTADSQMQDYPPVIQAAGSDTAIQYTGDDFRGLIHGISNQSGLVNATDFEMSAGSGWAVNISAGCAFINHTAASPRASYFVRSNGTVSLATPSAPASGTRYHRVVAEVKDASVSGTGYGWQFRLIEDTGSGLAAVPVGAISLGLVQIPAGASSVASGSFIKPNDRMLASTGRRPLYRGFRASGGSAANSQVVPLVVTDEYGASAFDPGTTGLHIREIPLDGMYRLTASGGWGGGWTGTHAFSTQIDRCLSDGNDQEVLALTTICMAEVASSIGVVTATCVKKLYAGQYVKATSHHTGSGSVDVNSLGTSNWFEIEYMRQEIS